MTQERYNIKALIAKLVPSKQKKTQVVITDKDLSDIRDILQEHTEVVSQRDELLEALKGIKAVSVKWKFASCKSISSYCDDLIMIEQTVEAAIKRAEGGKA